MQLLCNVDQAAAIRNGFNASSTVTLDVDIPSLTDPEREIIAERFCDGKLRDFNLEKPTPEGLREAMQKAITAQEEARKGKATREQKAREYVMRVVQARETAKTGTMAFVSAIRDSTGNIVKGRHGFDRGMCGCASYSRFLPCGGPSYTTAEQAEAMKNSVEYQEWIKELNEKTNEAEEAALKVAEEDLLNKEAGVKAAQEKEELHDHLRMAVIVQKGTELQKTRLERGLLDIRAESLAILCADFGTPKVSGCTLSESEDQENVEYSKKQTLTDKEMALVLELEKIEGVKSVELRDLEMEPDEDEDGDTGDEDRRTEAWVTVVRSGLQFRQDFLIAWD